MKALRDESGQTLVVVAAFMGLVAIGFLAFAVDVGSLFRQQRMAQAAADAAALAAGEELTYGNTSNEQAAADAIAKLNGFDTTLGTNPAIVTLTTPSSGNFTGSSYVQVTVSRPIQTIFMGAFAGGDATMAVSATAIAGGAQMSQTCVCLEGSSGQTLYMSGGASISASSCGVVSNSSASNAIGIVGGSKLTAATLGTVSNDWDNSSNINSGGSIAGTTIIVQGITSKCAPSMPAAPSYGVCNADPGTGGSNFTAGPASASGVICYNGLTIGANGTSDTLNPGTYVIDSGWLTFDTGSGGHSNLGGNGVFFYLTGTAALQVSAGANVNLVAGGNTESGGSTAPTVGIYNGILIYQAASDTAAMSISLGSTGHMSGAILAPGADVTLDNSTTSVDSGQIVANSLVLSGSGTVDSSPDVNEGSLSIGYAKLVQ
ncbi:MAG: pilus assembly protein TadG-related protein [Acidobacteriaceae bacterium]|jgi:Flp pilus assembly protein TadG